MKKLFNLSIATALILTTSAAEARKHKKEVKEEKQSEVTSTTTKASTPAVNVELQARIAAQKAKEREIAEQAIENDAEMVAYNNELTKEKEALAKLQENFTNNFSKPEEKLLQEKAQIDSSLAENAFFEQIKQFRASVVEMRLQKLQERKATFNEKISQQEQRVQATENKKASVRTRILDKQAQAKTSKTKAQISKN